jgi:hypothetical protein
MSENSQFTLENNDPAEFLLLDKDVYWIKIRGRGGGGIFLHRLI